jgi:hypothetical protein
MASRTIPGRWLAIGVALFIALVAGALIWLLLSRYQGHMFGF